MLPQGHCRCNPVIFPHLQYYSLAGVVPHHNSSPRLLLSSIPRIFIVIVVRIFFSCCDWPTFFSVDWRLLSICVVYLYCLLRNDSFARNLRDSRDLPPRLDRRSSSDSVNQLLSKPNCSEFRSRAWYKKGRKIYIKIQYQSILMQRMDETHVVINKKLLPKIQNSNLDRLPKTPTKRIDQVPLRRVTRKVPDSSAKYVCPLCERGLEAKRLRVVVSDDLVSVGRGEEGRAGACVPEAGEAADSSKSGSVGWCAPMYDTHGDKRALGDERVELELATVSIAFSTL